MIKAAIWAIIIVATACVFAGLYFGRAVFTEVALALMLWLAIESVAEHMRRFLPKPMAGAATAIAMIGIFAVFGVVGYEVTINIRDVISQAGIYEQTLDHVIAQVYQVFRLPADPPTIHMLASTVSLNVALPAIANAVRSVGGHAVFILIYLAFLYPAAAVVPHKLDRIFPEPAERAHVREVLTAIRASMAQYLWVQTILASLVGSLTYVTLLLLGLHNPVFWGVLAFFLNFIPTIGPIVAVALPVLFSIMQYGTLGPVALVAGGLAFWQFLVANFVQPRLMSESLNLAALVVLLSLAVWGLLWSLTGALLSAPLTVMIMIILAQFPSSRWLAVLLSADGEPGSPRGDRL